MLLEAVSTAFSQEQTKKTVFRQKERTMRHRVIQAEELPQQATQSYTQPDYRSYSHRHQDIGIPRKRTIISLAWMRSPRSLLVQIRKHWAIENQLHYVLT